MEDKLDESFQMKWKRSLRKRLINCLARIENDGKPTQELLHELAKSHISNLSCGLHNLYQSPALTLRHRARLCDQYGVAHTSLVLFVMCVHLRRPGNIFSIYRVLHAPLNFHRDGLVHLVTDDTSLKGSCLIFSRSHYCSAFCCITVFTRAISRLACFSKWLCPN